MAQQVLSCESGTDESWWMEAEPTHRWLRVKAGDEYIADSRHALVVREAGRLPVYYFPWADVRFSLLKESNNSTICSHKGVASYWDIEANDRIIENAAWAYRSPEPGCESLKGFIAFSWNKVDHWYEEEQEIFKHPRDPYHRVDALPSSRHIQVVLNGRTVADSTRPVIVFETGLTPRYYLPFKDIRTEYLKPAKTHTTCPYKGSASYWAAEVDGKIYEDIVWSYPEPEPVPEIPKIKGLYSFYNEKVDSMIVDGEKWVLGPGDSLPSNVRFSED